MRIWIYRRCCRSITEYEELNKVDAQYFPYIPAGSAVEVSKIPPEESTMQLDVIAL
ncbi:uncharacterized protein BDV17DRAFT_278433 [Aspergillus undulatus]|uniref:uncharacterized protein n=1 Tax=Aspergillus undulatus TaxID=1810928 RepID=UPI003CCDE807